MLAIRIYRLLPVSQEKIIGPHNPRIAKTMNSAANG